MTDENRLIERLASEIAGRITPRVPLSIDLWDVEIIATYLKVSPRQVAERYACHPDFPRPICLPTSSGSHQIRRWKATEIIAWAESRQARKRAA